jgi:hypothetical protein
MLRRGLTGRPLTEMSNLGDRLMAEFSKTDWHGVFIEMARLAQSKRDASNDPILRGSWRLAQEGWEHLARLRAERCFCGLAAIGSKFYERSERMPYCRAHLTEAITQDVLSRMQLRRLN